MSNKEMITCFNGKECCYDGKVCPLYDDGRTDLCRVESLKNFLWEKQFKKAEDLSRGMKREDDKTVVNAPKDIQYTSASDLVEGKWVNLKGTVLHTPEDSEVNTANGTKVVTRFDVSTDSGDVNVTIWENPDITKDVSDGDLISLTGFVVKPPYKGRAQVSSGKSITLTKLGNSFRSPTPPTPASNTDAWRRNSKDTGDYAFSDKLPDLANRIDKAGGKLNEGEWSYSLYGDPNKDGLPTFISRYPARRK